MTTSQESFYSGIDSALTPEQALQALALEGSGDTGTTTVPDAGGAPATTTVPDNKDATEAGTDKEQKGNTPAAKTDGVQEIPEDQQNADNTVALARDGKHTISFEQVAKTRAERNEYKAAAEAAQRQLAELQAQAQARADAGQAPTQTDQLAATAAAAIEAGADADLFGDFTEEDLKKGLLTLNSQMREQLRAELKEELKKELAPLREQQAKSEAESHYDAIYKAHPNADSIVQSEEFKAWVDSQPSVVRNAYWGLFDAKTGGSATEIVEVFDAYKAATEKTSSQPPAASKAAAAQAAAALAKVEPPASLSSIPGGHAQGGSALDATADMTGQEMLAATQSMSPAQLEAWLNKQI